MAGASGWNRPGKDTAPRSVSQYRCWSDGRAQRHGWTHSYNRGSFFRPNDAGPLVDRLVSALAQPARSQHHNIPGFIGRNPGCVSAFAQELLGEEPSGYADHTAAGATADGAWLLPAGPGGARVAG